MVLVEIDPVMMLATGVSATSRVLPVLSDPGQIIQISINLARLSNYLP